MADHFARPIVEPNPQGKGVAGLHTIPTCRVCGLPIYQPAPNAAPGAWRHTKTTNTDSRLSADRN